MRLYYPFTSLFLITLAAVVSVHAAEAYKPNIIYILADDLGYGDVSILNPTRGKIATPHLDRLAQTTLLKNMQTKGGVRQKSRIKMICPSISL